MKEHEAIINMDFTLSRESRHEPSVVRRRTPAITIEHCCVCNHADSPSLMAHVGDGVYKCRKCLGI